MTCRRELFMVSAMPVEVNPAELSRDELLSLVGQLYAQVAALKEQVATLTQQVAALQAENARLRAENEQLRRSGKRQATPFSKGKRVEQPKRPGRKRGEGPFRSRSAPPLEQITGWEEVPVTEPVCPYCGGRLEPDGVEVVTTTDIPENPQPEARAYEIERARCCSCGRRVRGRHPDVPDDQRGASAHRVGLRTMAAAHVLHYGLGAPQRKVPAILQMLSGLTLSQGSLARDAMRRAAEPDGSVARAYARLRAGVREAPVTYTDDTSWKVGGEPAQLMAFDTETATVYQIRWQHRNEEVRELLPGDYAGTMVCDRGKSYDAKELRGVKQQKCLSHVQRSLSEVLEKKVGEAREFTGHLKGVLAECIALRHGAASSGAFEGEAFAAERERLVGAVSEHLIDRHLADWDNARLLRELGRHHRAGNLLRFLFEPQVEPTNNRGERTLRPAVIARKVSHCSKNERGARAFEAFASVVQTLRKRGSPSVMNDLAHLFDGAPLLLEPT